MPDASQRLTQRWPSRYPGAAQDASTTVDARSDATVDAGAGPVGFRRSITIDRSQVGCASAPPAVLTDYALLIRLSDPSLRWIGSDPAGRVEHPNGFDITFTALDGVTCRSDPPCSLDHEIGRYDATIGELVAWVRVPALNARGSASDTTIYLEYGDGSVTSPTANPAQVWDASYRGVYHLNDDPASGAAGAIQDSTSFAHDATPESSMTAADRVASPIDFGIDFDGVDDALNVGSPAALDDMPGLTVSAWINPRTTGEGGTGYIASKNNSSGANDGRWLFVFDDDVGAGNHSNPLLLQRGNAGSFAK